MGAADDVWASVQRQEIIYVDICSVIWVIYRAPLALLSSGLSSRERERQRERGLDVRLQYCWRG